MDFFHPGFQIVNVKPAVELYQFYWHYMSCDQTWKYSRGTFEHCKGTCLKHAIFERRDREENKVREDHCLWEPDNSLFSTLGFQTGVDVPMDDLSHVKDACDESHYGKLILKTYKRAQNRNGYSEESVHQLLNGIYGMWKDQRYIFQEFRVKKFSKWSVFGFENVEKETILYSMISRSTDTVSTEMVTHVFGFPFWGCGVSLSFYLDSTRQEIIVRPMTVLELLGKVGGFATFILAAKIILIYFNQREFKNMRVEITDYVTREEVEQIILREKTVESQDVDEEAGGGILHQKNLLLIPM